MNGLTTIVLRFHRPAHWLDRRGHPRAARILSAVCRFFTGVEIEPSAVIGRNLSIQHGMGTVIGHGVVVGDWCVICQQVTLGAGGVGSGPGDYPRLGSSVTVFPGARIVGAVAIGDGAIVGANSVVTKDVAAGHVVGGVPARVLRARD